MKKVIITGGSGFIGSNLIKYLLKKKIFVINIDKSSYSSISYNLRGLRNKNYIFFKSDINNQKNNLQIFKKFKPNAIFNLAAETHVDRSIDNPDIFIKNNILGVYNLLESIRKYRKKNKKELKLIHISTDEVYGDIKNKIRSTEKFPYNPSSPYAASKASSDLLIKSYVRTFKIKAIITNCCNNYGPGQFPEKLIPTLVYSIANNKTLPIYGKGINSREWIYVEDHCAALFELYNKGISGENYNIGSGYNLSNLQLTKKLLLIAKKNKIKLGKNVKIKFVKDRPGHDLRYAINSTKLKKLTKWKIKNNMEQGLTKTLKWYLNNYSFFKSFSKKIFFKRLGLKI